MSESPKLFHNGRRLAFEKALCTVRYYGPLDGTQGQWLGVEWDDPSRGKHDGIHKGERIFRCRSTSTTAASFIRPSRKADPIRTVLDAIHYKYARSQQANGNLGAPAIEISGKLVEEIGFDRIQRQISVLEDLRIVLVDDLCVTGLTERIWTEEAIHNAQQELVRQCPSIIELDIGWNLIETWQDIADICEPFEHLCIIKASGLRLRDLDLQLIGNHTNPFGNIIELQLNETLLIPDELRQALLHRGQKTFPSLKRLSLSQNELNTFEVSQLSCISETVTEMTLENNRFLNINSILNLFILFPNITYLSLQANLISEIGSSSDRSQDGKIFPQLEILNLSDNRISDFSFIDALPTMFPSLTSLRISKNPLYVQSLSSAAAKAENEAGSTSTKSSDSTFFLTLARIPKLKSLNYTTITNRDREEGEIYYLSIAEKDVKSSVGEPTDPQSSKDLIKKASEIIHTKYPRYLDLCAKYDRDSVLLSSSPKIESSIRKKDTSETTSPSQTYAPGTLGSRLLNATFYIPSTSSTNNSKTWALEKRETSSSSTQTEFIRPLPPSLKVHTVKSLIGRHFKLPPLQFRLIYESEELDPYRDPIDSRKVNWDDWGDWDVDNVEEHFSIEHKDNITISNGSNILDGSKGGKWVDGYYIHEGQKFKKREVEILDGLRPWSDFIEDEVKNVVVRVEPFDQDWRDKPWDW